MTENPSRRWRVSVSILSWLLMIQAALGIIVGLLSLMTLPGLEPAGFSEQLAPILDQAGSVVLAEVMGQTTLVTRVSIVANLLLLVGSIGLLLRKKWGWFTVVLVHLAGVLVSFIWVMPVLRQVLGLLDPSRAGLLSFVITALLTVVPGVIIAFLMLKPVVSQYQRIKHT